MILARAENGKVKVFPVLDWYAKTKFDTFAFRRAKKRPPRDFESIDMPIWKDHLWAEGHPCKTSQICPPIPQTVGGLTVAGSIKYELGNQNSFGVTRPVIILCFAEEESGGPRSYSGLSRQPRAIQSAMRANLNITREKIILRPNPPFPWRYPGLLASSPGFVAEQARGAKS